MTSERALGPADLFDLQFLRGARLSPSGSHVAYVVSRTDDREWYELWVCDRTGASKRRVPYPGSAREPSWAPDGSRIAFVGDARLRIATFPQLGVSDPLTPEDYAVEGSASWRPDGARLAVSLSRRVVSDGPVRITSTHFRADGVGSLAGLEQAIYGVELSDAGAAAPRCLTPSQGMCSQPQWSPCGERILFFATDEAIPFASYSPRLCCVEPENGEVRELLNAPWYITCARWLPGGNRIAIAAARDSALTIPILSLWVLDADGGHADLRTAGTTGTMGFRVHHDMPAWDLTQDNILTVLDGSTALATVQKGGSAEVWHIALDGEVAVDRVLTGERSCIVLDANRDANALLFAVTDLRSPTELCVATLDGRDESRLTQLNDELISTWPAIEVEQFVFDSADGVKIEGWFFASAGRRGPLPTILFIHGGPYIATGYGFRYDFHLLAAHGFGVAFANFRGSAGYGEAFARAIMGDWGAHGYPDHVGAVNTAIDRGFADPSRLGVWGASHGGFATCWIVGHTKQFKAAVAEAALTHFATAYYLTDAPEGFRRELGGRPHEIPEIYRDRSPLTYAHQCTTPTLLLHGEDDLRCPISEAEQFYRALQDAACPTEMLRIPACSHLGDSMGPLSARRTQNEGLLEWFVRHL